MHVLRAVMSGANHVCPRCGAASLSFVEHTGAGAVYRCDQCARATAFREALPDRAPRGMIAQDTMKRVALATPTLATFRRIVWRSADYICEIAGTGEACVLTVHRGGEPLISEDFTCDERAMQRGMALWQRLQDGHPLS